MATRSNSCPAARTSAFLAAERQSLFRRGVACARFILENSRVRSLCPVLEGGETVRTMVSVDPEAVQHKAECRTEEEADQIR